jgi:hypothetical protein
MILRGSSSISSSSMILRSSSSSSSSSSLPDAFQYGRVYRYVYRVLSGEC